LHSVGIISETGPEYYFFSASFPYISKEKYCEKNIEEQGFAHRNLFGMV
jgi:hypothetical protein